MTKPSVVHSAAFDLVVCPGCDGKLPSQADCDTCCGDGFIDDPRRSVPAPIERCSCPEALHLRAALKRIGKICTDGPGSAQSWMDVIAIVEAALALEKLP